MQFLNKNSAFKYVYTQVLTAVINVRSVIQKQINNNVKMKYGGLNGLPLLLSIWTEANYENASYGVSVNGVTFKPGFSQEPRQTTMSVSDRLSQTAISQLSL